MKNESEIWAEPSHIGNKCLRHIIDFKDVLEKDQQKNNVFINIHHNQNSINPRTKHISEVRMTTTLGFS